MSAKCINVNVLLADAKSKSIVLFLMLALGYTEGHALVVVFLRLTPADGINICFLFESE